MSVAIVPSRMFSEVLLASDFSEESDRALTYAKCIVRGSGGGSFFSFMSLDLPRSLHLGPKNYPNGSMRPEAKPDVIFQYHNGTLEKVS